MALDFNSLLQELHVTSIVKIAFLAIIFLYLIFAFIIINQVQSLNKIVFIKPLHASRVVQALAVIYFLLTLSLFFFTLAIL